MACQDLPYLIPPQAEFDLPIELLLSEEDLTPPDLEGDLG
jgi:hypothetical protein